MNQDNIKHKKEKLYKCKLLVVGFFYFTFFFFENLGLPYNVKQHNCFQHR